MVVHPSLPVPIPYVTRHQIRTTTSPFTHIFVIIQENRTVDNMFNGFCAAASQCANTVTVDPYASPTATPLATTGIESPLNPVHAHTMFVSEYHGGLMDGFPANTIAYVPQYETQEYRQMFTVDGVLNDNVFAANQGPSFPAHQYGIAGQAGGYDPSGEDIAENPKTPSGNYTCGVVPPKPIPTAEAVSLATAFPGYLEEGVPTCEDHNTIFDLLTARGFTWSYYNAGNPLWMPTQNIMHLFRSTNFKDSANLITDIQSGVMPNVVFVTPADNASDHPGKMTGNAEGGGEWVAQIANAIGESTSTSLNWNNTLIIVYWDDFGGWFDHVKPLFARDPFLPLLEQNPNEYGLRVPYGILSAYATTGRVAHGQPSGAPCSTSDSLAYIEVDFGLGVGALGTEDQYNTGCTAGMINPAVPPHPYHVISASNWVKRSHR
jgi:phospholipase C